MSFLDYNLPPLSEEALASFLSKPELAADITEYKDLYERKLWHQVQLKIEESLKKP